MSKEFLTGIEKSLDRAILKASGLDDKDISKPLVGIIATQSSDFCNSVELITQNVKCGVLQNGCTPLVFCVASPNDGISNNPNNNFGFAHRELIADSVESIISSYNLDGVVIVGDYDNAISGALIGAVRCSAPLVVIGTGPTQNNSTNINAILQGIGQLKLGTIGLDHLHSLEDSKQGDGIFVHLHTMPALCEAMGISLLYNATAPAHSTLRLQLARQTGVAITRLVADSIQPSMLLTRQAFGNALTTLCAINGNLDCVVHIIALAKSCGIELSFDNVASTSQKTPTLLALQSLGQASIDFHNAGGMGAILNQLAQANLIDATIKTVANLPLKDQIQGLDISNPEVIFSCSQPYLSSGCIAVLKGNIADDGALCRKTRSNHNKLFVGKAKTFDSAKSAMSALLNGNNIKQGDVVVIKFEGPKGSPGFRDLYALSAMLDGYGLLDSVAIVTDGRLSFANGFAVGFVCPEVQQEGKLACIKDGDKITIDIPKGKLDADLSNKELNQRLKKFDPKNIPQKGWLSRYAKLVNGADKGAIV